MTETAASISTTNGAASGDSPTSPRGGPALTGEAIAFEKSMRFFLHPLLGLLEDDSVSEIMINGPRDVFVERKGRIELTGITFRDDHAVRAAANHIAQFVGKSITEEEPILDGRLPDGSRICIILPPISGKGVSVNIRKFAQKAINPEFLIDVKALTPEALEFILVAVEAAQNIIISGGTGSGKTTLLNIFSNAFPDTERIITIEDTRELQVQKQHVVSLESRPADVYGKGQITIRDLFVATLRMRPDRIVVGEVRRGEALDMLQAMSSGHSGSMATLHADTPMGACGRLETMCMMADSGLPITAIRRQIADALHLIVQAVRLHDGRRLVTHVTEIHYDEERNEYDPRDIFVLDTELEFPMLKWTGRTPELAKDVKWMGLADQVKLNRKMMGLE